eukprot:GHRR01021144.1.p2 GENE.GHRR01021144.1~~GHRR01021144.1.p2  ORF type:complete len:190 (+),score=28.97 GHRR01021144.1:916-1485(+)
MIIRVAMCICSLPKQSVGKSAGLRQVPGFLFALHSQQIAAALKHCIYMIVAASVVFCYTMQAPSQALHKASACLVALPSCFFTMQPQGCKGTGCIQQHMCNSSRHAAIAARLGVGNCTSNRKPQTADASDSKTCATQMLVRQQHTQEHIPTAMYCPVEQLQVYRLPEYITAGPCRRLKRSVAEYVLWML